MKILFVNENIGGHATVHHHLDLSLKDHGDVAATFLDVPAATGVRRVVSASIPGLARLDLDFQALRAQLAAAWWVRRRLKPIVADFDLIHFYTQNAALLSVKMMRGRPCVISLDTTNTENAYRIPSRAPARFTPLAIRASQPCEQRVYRSADHIVANTAWAARSLRQVYDVDAGKLTTMPFGIIGPEAVAERSDDRLPTIVFVGRQFKAKGGDLLLDIFRRRFTGRAELVLVTQEPVAPTDGVTVIDDMQQGDARLWEILADADIFAFPSSIDQAPNAIIEAMAAGLPVIAVRTSGIQEMVVDGTTGVLIEPGDIDGLGAALDRLIDDGDRRRSLGAAGRQRFEQRYDARRATDALLDIFRTVIADRGGTA